MTKTLQEIFGETKEVLYYFDGNRIFPTIKDDTMFFVYQCEQEELWDQFIVVPTSITEVKLLKEQLIDVKSILQKDILFLVKINLSNIILSCHLLSFEDLDPTFFPKSGVYLYY